MLKAYVYSKKEEVKLFAERKQEVDSLCRDFREKLKDLFEYTRNFYGLSQREFGPLIGMGEGATYYRWLNSDYNLINATYMIQFCLVFSVDISTIIDTRYGDTRLPTTQFLRAYTDFRFVQDSQRPAFYSLIKGSISDPPKGRELSDTESGQKAPEISDNNCLQTQNGQANQSSHTEIKKILKERKEIAAKICEDLGNQIFDIFEITRAFYSLSYSKFGDLISSSRSNPFVQFKISYRKGRVQMFNAEFIIRFGLVFDVDLNTIITLLVDWKTKSKAPENFYNAYSSFLNIQSQDARERFASIILNDCLPIKEIINKYKHGDSFKDICKEYDIDTSTVRAIIAKEKRSNSSVQRAKKPRISDEKTQEIVRLNEEGVHPQEIAKKLQISITSVYRILREKSKSRVAFERGRMTEEKLNEFHDLFASDMPIKEIAERTGFCQATICKYRKIIRERDAKVMSNTKTETQASPKASKASSKKSSLTSSATDTGSTGSVPSGSVK